jgi:hypothetical protein
MKKYLKKKWLIGAGVLALILLIIGITIPVIAAPGNSGASSYSNKYIDGPTVVRLAGVLGITPADLSGQLQSGKTLSILAQEHNVTPSSLEDAIVAPYADQLATQVKYGYLIQEQANTLLTNARNQAGYLLQKDISNQTQSDSQSDNDNDYYGDCYDYMTSNGYGPAQGWGGFMGPGMMYGWGSNFNNSNTPQNSSPGSNNNPSGNNTFRGPQNGGFGRGMGGGMMGSW